MNSLGRAGAIAAIVLTATSSLAAASAPVGAAPAPPKRPAAAKVVGRVPSPVTSHAVAARRPHDSDAVLALNLGLAVHHSAELDEVIRAASTPGSPSYGRYLTQAQYKARYAPTDAEVADVRAWLTANGLRVTGVSPSNLIVSAEATTAVAERAFGVTINDYIGERTFYANNVAPSVPADSSVRWVTGLDDSLEVKSFIEPAFRSGGYFPGDFQKGYHTGNATTTESIGFTLWGAPLPQSDFTQFATNTGSPAVVVNGVGANGINFIPCSTSSCNPAGTHSTNESVWAETALDVQSAHGVAPGSHMKYWLASTSSGGDPLQAALENALDAAANDSTVKVVSNSWGINLDIHIPTMDASLQHAAAVGKTFFFSSDDTADISYPATSPYVVSVGGTNLNLDGGFNYVSESAWNGSGTGCSEVFGRPSWQVGVGTFATCDGRAEPDVAADADPFTGAYTYYDGGSAQIGGTSLAAPLWAGMTAVWNQANITAGKPVVGFAAPLLYALGNNKTIYHDIFHDVTTGSAGGNPAGAGWDQVTGWGSPDLVNLIAASQGLASTSTTLVTSKNPSTAGGTVVFSATVSPIPNGGTVTFRQDSKSISGCVAKPLVAGGHASCSIKYSKAASYRIQATYSGNADYSGGPSNIIAQKINAAPPPAPTAGYWMAGRTGVVYGFGSAKSFGNANTQNVSRFEPTPSRKGYWIVNRAGQVFAFGDAHAYGNAGTLLPGESVSSLSATPSGHGYWLFTSKGRALIRGDAHFYGDLRNKVLNGPVVGSVATPTGHGYYMVATDGGIFSFGDAGFYGSTGHLHLNQPVNGLVPTPTNRGYWMVASDGGIFAFGDATFRGSMGGRHLNSPVVGMVRYGNGYLMVASDGGIFAFSDQPFLGSLAGRSLPAPIVSVAS